MKEWIEARLSVLENNLAIKNGDVNLDGKIDSSDAVAILRYVAGYTDEYFVVEYGDYNNDGQVNSSDSVAILRHLAGY